MSDAQGKMPWAPEPEPFVKTLPWDHRKRGAMQTRLLEQGKHPLTGEPIKRSRDGSVQAGTCGGCEHLFRDTSPGARFGVGVPKCRKHGPDDPRTGVTLKWPSCHEYEEKETPL